MIEFSEIQNIYFILPLLGFIVGLFGTMAGGGGGFFFLPMLTLFLKVPVPTAVITSLVAALPICTVGSWGHNHKNNINFKVAFILIVGGIIGAFVGAGITEWITGRQLKVAFGIYSILIALNMVLDARKKQKNSNETRIQNEGNGFLRITKGSLFGLVAGLITGTFGTSGSAPVIAGLFSLKIPFKKVIGTSLIVVLLNTVFAVSAHFLIGKIDLTLVSFLTAGSVLGAVAGPKLVSKVKLDKAEKSAGYWYAAVMVIIGVLMIISKN